MAEAAAVEPAKVETALRRVRSLKDDFELWCRKCYRIRTKSGEIVPLVLNPVQRAIRQAERDEIARTGHDDAPGQRASDATQTDPLGRTRALGRRRAEENRYWGD